LHTRLALLGGLQEFKDCTATLVFLAMLQQQIRNILGFASTLDFEIQLLSPKISKFGDVVCYKQLQNTDVNSNTRGLL